LAIELDPRYVDVAVRRWQAFTGAKGTLLADGRAFDAIAEERVGTVAPDKPPAASPSRGAKGKS
jgi:hypothetical protein